MLLFSARVDPEWPPLIRAKSVASLILVLISISTGGCVTASLATLGSVVGFLGSAASTGADVYKLGKLDAALMTTLPEAQRATRHAACDLGLQLTTDSPPTDADIWQIKLFDDRKREITVRLEQRAPHLCLCRVDVGFFGSEPTAKLIMERIRVRLPRASTQPISAQGQ